MRHFNFMPYQTINLRAKSETSTPTQAINEAIEFVKEHKLKYADLFYCGFCMSIYPESDLNELVSEYVHWRSIQTAP